MFWPFRQNAFAFGSVDDALRHIPIGIEIHLLDFAGKLRRRALRFANDSGMARDDLAAAHNFNLSGRNIHRDIDIGG